MSIVAAVEMNSSDKVDDNLGLVASVMNDMANVGAKIVLLPENFAFMSDNELAKLDVAETYQDGPIQEAIANLARKHQMWIIAGTIPIKSEHPNKVYAASIVFDDKGESVARYDKIHLFDVTVQQGESYCESNVITPGHKPICVTTPYAKLGLSVCYDLRFPELYRQLQSMGAEVFLVPAAFTLHTGRLHWQVLLRARAIENISYVVAANQVGRHGESRETFGHSMIINEQGEVMTVAKDGVRFVYAPLDLDKQNHRREIFPALSHRTM